MTQVYKPCKYCNDPVIVQERDEEPRCQRCIDDMKEIRRKKRMWKNA